MTGGDNTFEGSNFQGVYDVELDSGMAAGVEEIFFWPHFATPGRPTEATIGMSRGGEWIGGRDGELFVGKLAGVRTARPLPEGEYMLYFDVAGFPDILCDGEPEAQKKRTKIIVTVSAPSGTVHELFFDPVMDGTAVAADSTHGQLKPATFTGANDAAATLSSISYESSTVKVEVDPHDALSGQIVDFIELDGTVSLSLDDVDATVDDANDTLSWSVSSQPWEDGDLLMVRIREAPLSCRSRSVVPDAGNETALVSDCEALLNLRDELAGTAALNWSLDTTITSWGGVTVGGTPRTGLGEQVVTTKTLRRRFFSLAGRITRSARRLTLHLPQRWPWETQFSRALARLRVIPLPA